MFTAKKVTASVPSTALSPIIPDQHPHQDDQLHEVSTSASSRPPKDLNDSTLRIRQKLRHLQADDIARIGKDRQVRGASPMTAHVGYLHQNLLNVKRFISYVVEISSSLITGIAGGKLGFVDVFVVLIFATGTSITLVFIWFFCAFCTFPPLVWLYRRKYGELSIVNSSIPGLFESLTREQNAVAQEKLSAKADPKAHNPRVFDYDIAVLLLQISALMYERDPTTTRTAVNNAQARSHAMPLESNDGSSEGSGTHATTPGSIIQSLFLPSDIKQIMSSLEPDSTSSEGVISKFSEQYGLQFTVANELQGTTEAFCALFWEPKEKFVIVAFMGTDPFSFNVWATDFTAVFVNASRDIPGFNYVHQGFMETLLPPKGHQPYYSITAAVRVVCEELVKGHEEGTKINIWFTGHSLGTSLASIAYSKALVTEEDLGPHAVLRDAYCFATPVLCDVKTRLFFDYKMSENKDIPRTMWRVTNRNDFAATGIPQLGDERVENVTPDDMFNYSHLGVELYMKDSPNPSQVTGDAARPPAGFDVIVKSDFSDAELQAIHDQLVKEGKVQPRWITSLQYLPIIGRVAAHGTTNYWQQLMRIALEPAVYTD